MKKILVLVMVLSNLSCVDSVDDDGPLDEEFGYVDGKQDSPFVQDGSDEAAAILLYVNRTLLSENDVDEFSADLDTKLHSTIVENIIEFRLGSDDLVGTQDDLDFKNIRELDSVPFLGLSSLKLLFDLANEAGLFQATVSCNEIRPEYKTLKTVEISILDQLVEIEESNCTVFESGVSINITSSLPPKHRSLRAFDLITEIRGDLSVNRRDNLENPAFRSLQKVKNIVPGYTTEQYTTLYPELVEAESIVEKTLGNRFPKLESVGSIKIRSLTEATFPSLIEAESIEMYLELFEVNSAVPHTTDIFPQLQKVDSLRIQTVELGQIVLPIKSMTFTGLGQLKEVGEIWANGAIEADFDSLVDVDNIEIENLNGSFPELVSVNSVSWTLFTDIQGVSPSRSTMSASDYPFPKLENVTQDFRLSGGESHQESVLKEVGGYVQISTSLSNFDSLTTVGGDIEVYCANDTNSILNNLQDYKRALSINVSGDCDLGGFEKFKTVEAQINIEIDAAGKFSGLKNLDIVLGLDYWTRSDLSPSFPQLTMVLRDLTIRTPENGDISGFENLEVIDASLFMRGAKTISGLKSLRTIGKDITFSTQIETAERDVFLNQLTSFSGNIYTARQ